MPEQRNQPPARVPVRLRKCQTCGERVATVVQGECPDCAGLQPLPLRGSSGRFMSFTPKDGA